MVDKFANFQSGIEYSMAELLSDPTLESEKQFHSDLQTARFLVPLSKDGNLVMVTAPYFEGYYIPVFTSESELRRGSIDGDAEAQYYQTLKYLIFDDLSLGGIVINPFGRQIVLQRSQIEEIESAASGMPLKRSIDFSYVRIEKAEDCSDELVSAFTHKLKGFSEVYKVYIILATRRSEATPHLTYVIDFDGHEDQLFPHIAEIIRPYMRRGSGFELIKATYDLMMRIEAAHISPVYKKV